MLSLLATVFVLLGLGAVLVGYFQFIVEAWRKHALWAIGCFFFPLVSLAFLILNWKHAKKPFVLQVAGFGVIVFGNILSGG